MPRIVADAPDTPGYHWPGWEACTWDEGDHVHVVPLDDIVNHDEDNNGECICGVVTAPVQRDDGSTAWMYTHHALDGRPEDR